MERLTTARRGQRLLVVLLMALLVTMLVGGLTKQAHALAPAWAPNVAYAAGALASYNGIDYKCLQAHTSQVGWEPPNVPALWQPI